MARAGARLASAATTRHPRPVRPLLSRAATAAHRPLHRLGAVNAVGLAGLGAAAALWAAGHPVVALLVGAVLGAGLLRNLVRLAALPVHRVHLTEFVESWEHLTGREFGRGHSSDDVARMVYRQWRQAVRAGEAAGALGYLHRRASGASA